MKTAIKLVLLNYGFQILCMVLVMIPCFIYIFATGGDKADVTTMAVAPGMLVGAIVMGIYVWKARYLRKEKAAWSPVSPSYLLLTVILILPLVWLLEVLIAPLQLPDWNEGVFDVLQSGWVGILCVAVVAPIVEELVFREAITKELLGKYSPTKAILISGLIFGIAHFNPAQVVPVILIGFLLGWIYYKTASVIPCILLHIANNSFTVYLGLNYPEVDSFNDLVGGGMLYYILTGVAVGIVILVIYLMNRTDVKYPWKKQEPIEIITTND